MNTLQERLNDQNLDHFIVAEGGGAFGIGVEAGWLDEFRYRGARPRGIHGLGTSAGSWVLSMMETGVQFDDVADKKQIKLFNQDSDYMLGYARDVFGEARSGYVNTTASEIRAGLPKLEIWNGAEHDLAHMVTMSSSVPVIFAPARYNDRRYWDGAVAGVSAGYAHMAPRANKLIALSALSTHLKMPLPGPFQGIAGQVLEKKTRLELWRWQRQNPDSEVIYIKPNRETSALVETPKDIFSFKVAKEAYWMAREQVANLLDNEQDDPKLVKLREQVTRLLVELQETNDLTA
jgi:predicted acylesterase/phospholipase RssA